MKTEHEIKEAAENYIKPFKHQLHLDQEESVKNDFIAGAKWMQGHDNWIKFEDQQPEMYQSVIFVVDSSDERYNGKVYGGTYQGFKHDYYECSCPGSGFVATHWQPLPNPPKTI